MTVPRELVDSEILPTAMRLVSSARARVQMTMSASEELAHPLPRDYFLLLRKKMSEGVSIIRIGFGSAADFDRLGDRVRLEDPNYRFVPSTESDYRRMLLVDDCEMLYAITRNDGRHVFHTTDKETIAEFRHYFEKYLA